MQIVANERSLSPTQWLNRFICCCDCSWFLLLLICATYWQWYSSSIHDYYKQQTTAVCNNCTSNQICIAPYTCDCKTGYSPPNCTLVCKWLISLNCLLSNVVDCHFYCEGWITDNVMVSCLLSPPASSIQWFVPINALAMVIVLQWEFVLVKMVGFLPIAQSLIALSSTMALKQNIKEFAFLLATVCVLVSFFLFSFSYFIAENK